MGHIVLSDDLELVKDLSEEQNEDSVGCQLWTRTFDTQLIFLPAGRTEIELALEETSMLEISFELFNFSFK